MNIERNGLLAHSFFISRIIKSPINLNAAIIENSSESHALLDL